MKTNTLCYDISLKLLACVCMASISVSSFSASPGGVTDSLELWVRADSGVTVSNGGVDEWSDQSTLSNDASQVTSNKRPVLSDDLSVDGETLNFNPSVVFDGSNDLLDVPNLQLDDGASIFAVAFNGQQGSGGSQFKPFIISKDDHDATDEDKGFLLIAGRSNSNDGDVFFIPPHSNSTADEFVFDDVTERSNRSAMWLGLDDTNDQSFIYRNGELKDSNLNVPTDPGAPYTTGYDIGGTEFSTERFYKGGIAEIIAFDEKLSPANIAKVNSYLGIKYGITLYQQDLVLSDDTMLWDYSENTAYHNDVAAIATDTGSELQQKISRSYTNTLADQAFSISMSMENTFNTLNNDAGRTLAMADKSGLVWGRNSGDTGFGISLLSSGDNKRINRIWKTQQTGTASSVFIAIPGAVYFDQSLDGGNGAVKPGEKLL